MEQMKGPSSEEKAKRLLFQRVQQSVEQELNHEEVGAIREMLSHPALLKVLANPLAVAEEKVRSMAALKPLTVPEDMEKLYHIQGYNEAVLDMLDVFVELTYDPEEKI